MRSFVLLLLIGCSQTSPPQNRCTPESHVGCASALSFASGPDLPRALDHHATCVVGDSLYVLGGNDYRAVYKKVWRAPIAEDGSLGDWSETTPLPLSRAGQGVAVLGNRIVMISGQASGSFLDTVLSAAVQPDGSLGPWETEPSLPEARFHSYVATSDGWLYVTGGLSPAFEATQTIYRAPIQADGHLGEFTSTTPLPVPRSHHVALVHDGALFLAGGLTGNPAASSHGLAEVLRAPLDAEGTPGEFSVIRTLENPPATLAGFELDGAWYLLGGIDDRGHYLGDIRRLAFDGSSDEVVMPGLPVGRSHVHQTPLHGNHFYSVGGSVAYQKTTAAAQVGTFTWN